MKNVGKYYFAMGRSSDIWEGTLTYEEGDRKAVSPLPIIHAGGFTRRFQDQVALKVFRAVPREVEKNAKIRHVRFLVFCT